MKVGVRAILLGMCGLLVSGSHAFIYEVKVLKKWDSSRNRYHYFMGCSDFHDKKHDATTSQVTAIKELLEFTPKDKTKVIIEDLSTENNCGRRACGRFCLNSRGGILGGLTQTCRSYGLDAANIEYRYCRVIALGPLLQNLKADPAAIPSLKGILVSDIIREMEATMDEIKTYDDGNQLTAWYTKMVKDLTPHIQRLHMAKHAHDSMADYIRQHTNSGNRLATLKYMLTFDSSLLDIKMMHAIKESGDKERIIAFAGGTHIARVVDMLKKIGYQEVYTTKPSYFQERNLHKCVGSHVIDGAFCVRPHAIDTKEFKKLLNPKAF